MVAFLTPRLSQIIGKGLPYFNLSVSACVDVTAWRAVGQASIWKTSLDFIIMIYLLLRMDVNRHIRLHFVTRVLYTVKIRHLLSLNLFVKLLVG